MHDLGGMVHHVQGQGRPFLDDEEFHQWGAGGECGAVDVVLAAVDGDFQRRSAVFRQRVQAVEHLVQLLGHVHPGPGDGV